LLKIELQKYENKLYFFIEKGRKGEGEKGRLGQRAQGSGQDDKSRED